MADARRSSVDSTNMQALSLGPRRKKRLGRRLSTTMISTYDRSLTSNSSDVRGTGAVKRQKSSPASYSTAAPTTQKNETGDSQGAITDVQQYDKIMNRFQIRLRQNNFGSAPSSFAEGIDQSRRSTSRKEPGNRSEIVHHKQGSRFEGCESHERTEATQIKEVGSFHLLCLDQSLLQSCCIRFRRVAWKNLLQPISPYSTVSRTRTAALVSSCFAYAVILPVQVGFSSTIPAWFYTVGNIVDLMLLIDFIFMFNTSFVDKHGSPVLSRQEIASHYIRGWFVPDLLSSIPIHWLRIINSQTYGWFFFASDILIRTDRLIHLLHVLRLAWFAYVGRSGKSIWTWFLYSRYSYLIRITWIVGLVLLLAHYVACFWKILKGDSGLPVLFIDDYAEHVYDALQLLQGQGLPTTTVGQNVFASFSVLAGSVVLAIVFGHVAMLVSNFNANTTNYQRKMESVFAIMTKMQLPAPLRERIHQYYEHLWREYDSLDGEIVKFSKDLTHNLALEVVLFKYMALVMHVPFWRDCSADFQKQIVLHLQVRVYLPDDFIIRRGEVGDEFYLINRGCCELARDPESFEHGTPPLHNNDNIDECRDDSLYSGARYNEIAQHQSNASERLSQNRSKSERVDADPDFRSHHRSSNNLAQLNRGQAFGEIALLMNYERTANVRAVSYVEMCVLGRSDFEDVLKRYPVDRRHVVMQILTRFMDQNESHRGFCPLKDMVRSVMYDGKPDIPLSTMHAALLVAEIIDPKLEDETVKFGIDTKLAQQLSALKTNSPSPTSADPAISPALEARLGKIEDAQNQTLRVVQSVLRVVEDLKRRAPRDDEVIKPIAEPERPLFHLRTKDVYSHATADPQPKQERYPIHPRRSSFVMGRSTSAPNIHELMVVTDQSDHPFNTDQVEQLVSRFASAHMISGTDKAKLIVPGNYPIRSVAKQGSERRMSLSTKDHSEIKPRKSFFERLAQFGTITEIPAKSPTLYADQLFQPRPGTSNLPATVQHS